MSSVDGQMMQDVTGVFASQPNATSRSAEDVPNDLKGKLAGIADVLNQELRENHGDQYQIKNYLFTDFRPVICKLVDLCKEHSSKQ